MSEDINKMEEKEGISLDFVKLFNTLKQNWKTLAIWTACGFVIGCAIALSRPHKFEVVSKIAPELSSSAANRMSSLASMIGLSSMTLGTTDAIYPMVYPDLLKSPYFIADLFDTPVSFKYKGEQVDTTLFAYLSDYQKFSLIGAVMSLPGRLFSFEGEDDVVADSVFREVDPFHFTKKEGRIFKAIQKSINAEIDKRTLVVTIRVTMNDPLVCATVARAINNNLKEAVTIYRTQKAVQERNYFLELCEQNRTAYYDAQERYSRYSDTHQNIYLQSVLSERERLHNEVLLQSQIYNNTSTQLQSAEAKILLETPVFAEIVQPTVPLISKDSRKRYVLVVTFLAFCAGAVRVLLKENKKK